MLKLNLFLTFTQMFLLILVAFFGLALEDNRTSIYISLIIYLISLVIVNYKKINLINLSTFFLLGFGILIYGRLIAHIINPSVYTLDSVFCLGFFLNTCLTLKEATYSLLFFNLSLIGLSSGYILNSRKQWNIDLPSVSKFKLVILTTIAYTLTIVRVNLTYSNIQLTLNSGYNVLYEGQAEPYESPYTLAMNSLLIAILAILYVQKERYKFININFRILLFVYLLLNLSGIMTGSRASFIAAIVILLWYKFNTKKIPKLVYPFFLVLAFLTISVTNYLASLSGARKFSESSSLSSSFSDMLFSQGVTYMVVDAAIKLQDPPFLGYLKTLLPGIQALFPLFGIDYRYQFDWGSYLAYVNNPSLYNAGFGLGWSIWADFYLLSFGFLPIYLLLTFYWGRYLNNLDTTSTPLNQSLAFLLLFTIFSLSRNSISPLIFTMILYFLILFWLKAKVRL